MNFILILGLLAAGVSVGGVLRAFTLAGSRGRQTFTRIGAYGFNPVSAVERKPSAFREVFGRIGQAFGLLVERHIRLTRAQELRRLLNAAGLYRVSVASFLGSRVLAALLVPCSWLWLAAVAGLGSRAILGAVALAGIAWTMPMFLLKRKVRLRLVALDHEVPELVDLLVTTVEAGVGFTSALQLSARHIEGPLGEELRLVLREQSMGLTVEEALRNMLTRTDTPILRAFVQAILQGEVLGVSIGKILRDLAVDMRKRRRQAAEERAQKAPTKILFPLVGLILPALFIVSLGPMVVAFFKGISSF
jgi:tight adherence protein C